MNKSYFYSLASPVYHKTIENQGYTCNINGIVPDRGYMVGLKGFEQRVNILEFSEAHVDSFIRKNLHRLYDDNVYLGTWINGETVYIDLSINLKNKAVALAYGLLNGQICVWDVLRKLEIYQLV